jgi:hypothetical protein
LTTPRTIGRDLVSDLLKRHDRYGPWQREGHHWVYQLGRRGHDAYYEVNTQVGTPGEWLRQVRCKRWATPEVLGYLVQAFVDWGHLS